jgi:hypothetical protein
VVRQIRLNRNTNMQKNENGQIELDCHTCVHDGEICACNIYSGDASLKNLYRRVK